MSSPDPSSLGLGFWAFDLGASPDIDTLRAPGIKGDKGSYKDDFRELCLTDLFEKFPSVMIKTGHQK